MVIKTLSKTPAPLFQYDSVQSTMDEATQVWTEQKDELLAQHVTAQEDERKLVEDLTAKYGIGNLDLDTGIFTPNE